VPKASAKNTWGRNARAWALRSRRGWFKSVPTTWMLAGAVTALTLFVALAASWHLSRQLPLSAALKPLPQPALALATSDGDIFARRGRQKEDPVRIEEVPEHFIHALLAMEDARFYYHPGIDPIAMTRAAVANYRGGRVKQGASTLTQQLAKFSLLTNERSYRRKLHEAVVALWLEVHLSKSQILEHYLSGAYFGDGVFGLRAAALHYFDKEVRDLSLAESALLVGSLKAPSTFSPRHNPAMAQERARLVLSSMIAKGWLEEEALASVKPAEVKATRAAGTLASHFADWAVRQPLPPSDPLYGERVLKTTLDAELQKLAEKAVSEILDKKADQYGASEAALVALRRDGSIVAMVGGRDYRQSQFNRATDAMRQPGSAFKLFVYLAALRAGAEPGTMAPDRPIEIGNWRPQNYGGGYRGSVPLDRAFASSINTVAVWLSERVGRQRVIKAARDLGITSKLHDMPSLALGSSEVTLLELTAAYASVAAGRYPVRPRAYEDPELAAIDQRDKRDLRERPQLLHLLNSVVSNGTGRGARLSAATFGKTGTSQEHRDGWFVGFAGDLVVGVWVGNDDNTPMKRVTGGGLPAEIWRGFMNDALTKDMIGVANYEYERPRQRVERAPPKRRVKRNQRRDRRGVLRRFGYGF
jgi:penicillin-binding protein 1A